MSEDGTRRKVRVFFSWQSDLPQDLTTRAIRGAIRSAMTSIEAELPVEIIHDEALRDTAGSPYIPYVLRDKIRQSDIFVADITTVARIEGDVLKSLPNANVTFELGLASAEIGWERIVMLFNKELAAFDHLPFDFDRHRISDFRMGGDASVRRSQKSELDQLMTAAIRQIMIDDPKRPWELEEIPEEEIKRSRDVANLRAFLQRMSTVYLDRHIEDLPTYLNYFVADMAEEMEDVAERSDFLFYDPDLSAAITGIRKNLAETLSYPGHYRETANPSRQSFGRPGDMDLHDAEQRAAWDKIDAARNRLKKGLDALIAIVRERYLEVNIDETNAAFAERYAESVRRIAKEGI